MWGVVGWFISMYAPCAGKYHMFVESHHVRCDSYLRLGRMLNQIGNLLLILKSYKLEN